jgi:hypothetical protein
MARRDRSVDVVPIERAVAGEGRDRRLDPVEQGADLRAVIGILVRQRRRDDVARVGVRGKVELASPAPRSPPMLLGQPLAGTAELLMPYGAGLSP